MSTTSRHSVAFRDYDSFSLSRFPWARFLPLVLASSLALWGAGGAMAETEGEAPTASAPCADMVALDDGSVESGYGFVPSAKTGVYVQAFDASQRAGSYLTGVCLCFLKTRGDHDIDFEVVVYADHQGRPSREPIAAIPASQTEVAASKAAAGEFVEVEIPDVKLPAGTVYIGARWNPSEERFLFLCNDQTEATPKTRVFFTEDRAPMWTSVDQAKDPIFKPHRAVMVRARTTDQPPPEMKKADGSATPRLESP